MVVRLNVTRDVLDGVIVVPTEAVVRDERGTSVFVVSNDTSGTVASRRVVELGPNAGATGGPPLRRRARRQDHRLRCR